jgi:hypothetical protein
VEPARYLGEKWCDHGVAEIASSSFRGPSRRYVWGARGLLRPQNVLPAWNIY